LAGVTGSPINSLTFIKFLLCENFQNCKIKFGARNPSLGHLGAKLKMRERYAVRILVVHQKSVEGVGRVHGLGSPRLVDKNTTGTKKIAVTSTDNNVKRIQLWDEL